MSNVERFLDELMEPVMRQADTTVSEVMADWEKELLATEVKVMAVDANGNPVPEPDVETCGLEDLTPGMLVSLDGEAASVGLKRQESLTMMTISHKEGKHTYWGLDGRDGGHSWKFPPATRFIVHHRPATGGLIHDEEKHGPLTVENNETVSGEFTSVEEEPDYAAGFKSCGALSPQDQFGCTRAEGHTGRHEAGVGWPRVIAVWGGEKSNHSDSKPGDREVAEAVQRLVEAQAEMEATKKAVDGITRNFKDMIRGQIFQWGPGTTKALGLYRNSPKLCTSNEDGTIKYQPLDRRTGKATGSEQKLKYRGRDELTWIPSTFDSPVLEDGITDS